MADSPENLDVGIVISQAALILIVELLQSIRVEQPAITTRLLERLGDEKLGEFAKDNPQSMKLINIVRQQLGPK